MPPSSTYVISAHQRYGQTDGRTDGRHTTAIPLHRYSMERKKLLKLNLICIKNRTTGTKLTEISTIDFFLNFKP